jgi:hypothetical protein
MALLKRKSDAEPVAAPRWHTNFRDFERLPDTKVVRTAFFINTAAVVVAVGMLLWVGFREYANFNIREQIKRAEADIQANSKQNAEATKLSRAFIDQTKKLDEVAAFIRAPISPFEFVRIISENLPKEILIDSIETRAINEANAATPTPYTLRGKAAGSPDQASGAASQYVDLLRNQPRLAEVFESINLSKINRDASGSFLTFEISLTVKGAAKKK